MIGFIAGTCSLTSAAELHVSVSGRDSNPGSATAPLRSIQRAADLAQPGDEVVVHEGVYRERINPPRGGTSDSRRIVYRAATGERVEIRGSEVVKHWTRTQGDVWKAVVPNTLFGDFNPYGDEIRGDWFNPHGRTHHTGAVYLNGDWLAETTNLEQVLDEAKSQPLWFAEVDADTTTIWARFTGVDPNSQLVEINVRRTVFYPEKPGRDFITVRGFALRHAATPWAPPTAEQVGLIGTHWSKGWIIEDNTISHSICSGVSLGKYGDQWDNTSANTAEGYVKTIARLEPWLEQGDGRASRRSPQHHLTLRAGGCRRQPRGDFQHDHRQHHSRHPRAPALHGRGWPGSNCTQPSTWRSATITSITPVAASGSIGWRRARVSLKISSTTTRRMISSSR